MEAVYFNEEGGGPESGRTSTTTEMVKKYYTKRTRMRLDQQQEKGHGNPAHDKEMRHEAIELMPKPATANGNSLLFPRTNKNDSYPFDYNYGGSGGFEHIQVGSLYELNHSFQLPDKNSIPAHLKSVRVVMVVSRTEVNVTLRFPSVVSLHTHYSSTNAIISDDRNKRIKYKHPQLMKKEKLRVHPELDEDYVMNLNLAGKLLIRKILSSEFSKKKHLKSFWTLTSQQSILASAPVQDNSGSDDYYVSDDDDDDDGNCNDAQVGRIGLNRGTENYQSNLCRSSPVAVGRWASGGSSRDDSSLFMRKRGTCWSSLTDNSDLLWGVRRRRVGLRGYSNKSYSNNDHHQDYVAEISNKRFMRKSNNSASEHQSHQHQSSLGIFEAVPEAAVQSSVMFPRPYNAERKLEYCLRIVNLRNMRKSGANGTFLLTLKHPEATMNFSDSRLTSLLKKIVDALGQEREIFRIVTTVNDKGTFETRSQKIHCLENFVTASATGNRDFNLAVKYKMQADGIREHLKKLKPGMKLGADEVAGLCHETMMEVRTWPAFLKLDTDNKLSSTFILGMVEDGIHHIRSVDLDGKISDCPPGFAFEGDYYDDSYAEHIREYLHACKFSELSLSDAVRVGMYILTVVTRACERGKAGGDATVGGCVDLVTMQNLDKKILLPTLAEYPFQKKEEWISNESIIIRYEFDRIEGSLPYRG